MGAIVSIQESFRDDVIRAPLKVDGPALPGAEEGNPGSLKGRDGVSSPRPWHALANHNGAGTGPGIQPRRIGRLTR